MALEFKDIGDWTPSTISIVDVPYHPLAYFEVYENDEEFVKKFSESKKRDIMANNPDSENNVTMSEGFFERLLNGFVAKMAPEPTQTPQKPTGDDEVTNAQILEKIEKFDARLTTIENNMAPSDPDPEPNNDDDPESDDGNAPEPTPEPPAQKTVELPLNDDGTLNLEDGIVAKYLPRGTSNSQALDGDLTRGNSSGKSLNERTGRNENGMNW